MHKPEPAIYELGCERVGLAPAECVFVDDLRENCEGAEAVGMTAVLHRGADRTLPRLEELLGVASACAIAQSFRRPYPTLGPWTRDDRKTVVIGAGPAGLATAAQLRRRGVPVLVLERSDAVASSWRCRYDRLRLNSGRPFSKLPGARYPRGTGIFPSRDQVVEHLEDYARDNQVDVRFRTRVERIDRDGSGWLLTTSTGEIAAGPRRGRGRATSTPSRSRAGPAATTFEGRLIHSAEYRNPETFRGHDVLVVGPGCSGMEIAYDLARVAPAGCASRCGRLRTSSRASRSGPSSPGLS